MTTTPGWYPDPQVPALLRWWDGQEWTQQTAAAAGAAPGTQGYAPPVPPPPPVWASPNPDGGGVPTDFLARQPAKRHRLRWVIVGAAALIVIGATTVGIVAANSGGSGPGQTAQATAQATGYLRDLSRGAWTSAYARLCLSDRRQVSPSRFAASKAGHHPLSFVVTRTTVTTLEGVRTATVGYSETTSDRGPDRSTLTVQYTSGSWFVCHPGIDPDQWAGPPTSTDNSPTLST